MLCPAMGWTPNFHAYAIRKIATPMGTGQKAFEDRLKALEEECWVGPKHSTALDVFFQPLYVGGVLARDNKVLLGDLFYSKKSSSCFLQYVQDLGCWWSHTIQITVPSENPNEVGGAAVLISGAGACPPDDSEGILGYSQKMMKLVNHPGNDQGIDPASSDWWDIVNTEWRAKPNKLDLSRPFEFDLQKHQAAIRDALSQPKARRHTEHLRATFWGSGVAGSAVGPTGTQQEVKEKVTDPTKICAVCGVTAGIKACANCRMIAFCSHEHQLEFWPQHKAACKAALARPTLSAASKPKSTRKKSNKKKKK